MRRARVSSAMTVSLKALCNSGRFIQTVATPSLCSTSRVSYTSSLLRAVGLHSEHAKAGFLDRGVEGGGDAKREHSAHVDRVNHAVVPQAGGRIIGMALRLVLLPDR